MLAGKPQVPGLTTVPPAELGVVLVRKLCLLGVAGCLVTTVARAQEEPDASTNVLQEVTVTAQFRRESAQDTPLAITAVTAEMLDQRSVVDLAGAAGWSPNVNLARGTEGFGQVSGVFIRGI